VLVSSFAFAIGQIAHPFFVAFAWLLAQCYALVPSYAIAISLLTIAVMVVVSPITSRATRSMMKMQLLAPELKALRTKYATTAGMSAQERQEARQALNDEMLALYRANDVSPTGGCLPILLQLPIFWILYGTIRGLIHSAGRGTSLHAAPLYVSHTSRIYRDIVHAVAGHLTSFGMNLADSLRTGGLGWSQRGPYLALVLLAVGLQYLQMKQLSGRNRNPDASSVSPRMRRVQWVFPIVFSAIYFSVPAGVNVYFVVSSLFRIAQQELIYRHGARVGRSIGRRVSSVVHKATRAPQWRGDIGS
jgi:YidC/Oxa1 family membrane protein insertase